MIEFKWTSLIWLINNLFICVLIPYMHHYPPLSITNHSWKLAVHQERIFWKNLLENNKIYLQKKSSKKFWNIGCPIFSKLPPTLVRFCPILLDPTPHKIGRLWWMIPIYKSPLDYSFRIATAVPPLSIMFNKKLPNSRKLKYPVRNYFTPLWKNNNLMTKMGFLQILKLVGI